MLSRSSLPRPLLGLLAMTAIAIPVGGCGGDSSGAGGGDADPASAIPASVPVYAEAVVRPEGDLKADVEAVAGKLARTGDPGGAIVKLIDEQLEDENVSYAKDIEPWLGKRIGVAVTGVKRDGADAVVSAAVTDGDKAQDLIDRETKGAEVREHAGTKYRFKAAEDSAIALLGDTLVFGTENGVKAAIDATKGDALSESDAYARARDAAGDAGIGFFYLDPARTFDLVGTSGAVPQGQLGPLRSALTGSGVKTIAGSIEVEEDAIRIDAVSVGGKAPAAGGDAAGAVAGAPSGAWLALGVGDVGATIEKAIGQLASAGGLGGVDPQTLLQQLNRQAGIDIQKDLLSWMGDATLFVRGTSTADLGGALVVTSKDPAASRRAVGEIRRLLRTARLDPSPSTAGGLDEGYEVGIPGQGEGVVFGVKGEKFVVAYGEGSPAAALEPSTTLGDSQPYKDAQAALGDDTRPVFFLDVPQVVKLLQGFVGNEPDFRKAKPTLDAFGPLAAGASRDGDVQHFKLGVKVR